MQEKTTELLKDLLDPDGTYSILVDKGHGDMDFRDTLKVFAELLERPLKTGRRAAIMAQRARKQNAG